jgi:hypothetical protein
MFKVSEADIETAKPSPDEIETMLAEMLRGGRQDASDWDMDDLWMIEAVDPDGETKGYGADSTVSDATVAAWIVACDEDGEETLQCWMHGTPISQHFYESVPRHVPEGWTFVVGRADEKEFELLKPEEEVMAALVEKLTKKERH